MVRFCKLTASNPILPTCFKWSYFTPDLAQFNYSSFNNTSPSYPHLLFRTHMSFALQLTLNTVTPSNNLMTHLHQLALQPAPLVMASGASWLVLCISCFYAVLQFLTLNTSPTLASSLSKSSSLAPAGRSLAMSFRTRGLFATRCQSFANCCRSICMCRRVH
jgi:hypothetical protein